MGRPLFTRHPVFIHSIICNYHNPFAMFKKTIPNFTKKVDFSVNTIEKGHHQMTYRGVPIIKCPFDYVIYQMIISQIKPDLIIEIGTNRGGSSLYFADILETNNSGIVHTIDIIDIADPIIKSNPRIKTFLNGWQGYDISNTNNYDKILVIEDGSHTYEDSIGALRKFSRLVNQGSYYIVEDGIIDKLGWKKKYYGGPQKAIFEFLQNNNNFIIDRSMCDLFGTNATFNVNGYLKRV